MGEFLRKYYSRPNQFERFRGLLGLISRFEFDFLRREFFFERFEFLVWSMFNHKQCGCPCACAVACLHPDNSISNVVVSVTTRFLSVPQHNTTQHNTQHNTHKHHTHHTTPQHTETETETDRNRERQRKKTETERDRERRQRKRETERDRMSKTREDDRENGKRWRCVFF